MEVLQVGSFGQGDQVAQGHIGNAVMKDSIDDIDIDALLSRPRPLGRIKRRPLYKAPEFLKRLNAFEECKAGADVIFECHWKAFPKPEIRWFRDDEDITHNGRYQVKEADNGVLTLTIGKAGKKDEAAYRCRLENQEGSSSTTGYLTVIGDFSDKPLSARPRRNAQRAVSLPPHLRSIIEQKSMEEEEAEICSRMPPSPIQDFIDKATGKAGPNYLTWPLASRAPPPEENLPDSSDQERKIDTAPDCSDWNFEVPSREQLQKRREERAARDLMQRLDSVEKEGSPVKKTADQVTPMTDLDAPTASLEAQPPPAVGSVEYEQVCGLAETGIQQFADERVPATRSVESSFGDLPPTPVAHQEIREFRVSAADAAETRDSRISAHLVTPSPPPDGLVQMADQITQSLLAEAVQDKRCLHVQLEAADLEPPVVCEAVEPAAAAAPPRLKQEDDLDHFVTRLQTEPSAPLEQIITATHEERSKIPSSQLYIQLPEMRQGAAGPSVTIQGGVAEGETEMVDAQAPAVGMPKLTINVSQIQPSIELPHFPWRFYLAFTCCAAFVGLATDMFPVWYILLIFLMSLSSFRFVVKSPPCT